MNKCKLRILILVITMFIVLNIVFGNNILAKTTTTNSVVNNVKVTTTTTVASDGSSSATSKAGDNAVGTDIDKISSSAWTDDTKIKDIEGWTNKGHSFSGIIGYSTLSSHGDLLCSDQGGYLHDDGVPYESAVNTSGSSFNASDVPDLTPKNTVCNYTPGETKRPTPKEMFILSQATCASSAGFGEYTPAQTAWWNTQSGGAHGGSYNELYRRAVAFENYILRAADVESLSELGIREDGFYDLKYEPKWRNDTVTYDSIAYDCSAPTVCFDGEDMVVGPFAMKYVYDKNFAMITEMKLETNDPAHSTLELNTDWEIANVNKENKEYPLPNQPFYIVIHNKYDATQITNIHVDFAYTNGRGSFRYLEGEYKKSTTTKKIETVTDTVTEPDGTQTQVQRTKYSWTIVWGSEEAQRLTDSIDVEIKKFTTFLDRKVMNLSQVEVEKIVVDENGNKINLEEKDYFDFDLVVSGAENPDGGSSEKIRVASNSKATSKTYYWSYIADENGKDISVPPTYSIREINWPSEYEFISIEPSSGQLSNGQTIKIVAKNKFVEEKTGSLDIVKKAAENPLAKDGKVPLVDGQPFNFEITVKGKFKYKQQNGTFDVNGQYSEYKDQTITIKTTAIADGKAHNVIPSNAIVWYENEAPTYTVKEINIPEKVKLTSITPNSGSLKPNGTVTVTAINDQAPEKGRLEIIKTLKDGEKVYTEEQAQKIKFNFELIVEGYDKEDVSATFFEKREDGTYVWKYESKEYQWLATKESTDGPKYTIKEVNNPEGTVFDKAATTTANAGDTTITVTDDGLTGTLKAGDNKTGVVTNNVVNNVTTGKIGNIEITKKVADEDLIDSEFSFTAIITGKFAYDSNGDGNFTDDEWHDNAIIQLTNYKASEGMTDAEALEASKNGYTKLESVEKYNNKYFVKIKVSKENLPEGEKAIAVGKYISNKFKWYGESPKYKIEEDLTNEDINHSINPSEGYLVDGTQGADGTITSYVTAWNGHDRAGYIHIIKQLENADKAPIDYVKDLKFKFKIHVDGNDDYTVTLNAERKDNKWVWETTEGPFSWGFDEEAPNYTVEEDISGLTSSIVFKQANGSTDNKITGQLIANDATNTEFEVTNTEFINTLVEHEGKLQIEKEVTHNVLNGKEFKFDVTLKGKFNYNGTDYDGEHKIENIVVTPNNGKGKSEEIIVKWYGDEAPTYVVEEQKSDYAEIISKTNDTGSLKCIKPECGGADTTICTAKFKNGPTKTGGYLQIQKLLSNGDAGNKTFQFEITIGDNAPYTISLKANETYKSDYIEWYSADEKGPKYTVKELSQEEIEIDGIQVKNDESAEIGKDYASGYMKANTTIEVVVTNKFIEKTGNFEIVKEIVPNKLIDSAVSYSFEMKIQISGTFEMNGKTYYDTTYEYTESIVGNVSGSSKYTSPQIKWWGNNAPTVKVTEINIPKGWRQVGSVSNNGAALVEGGTVTLTVTNELPVYAVIDLTIELAGEVWEEDVSKQKNYDPKLGKINTPDGIMDSDEDRIKGVEVYVYRVLVGNGGEISRSLATAYNDNLNSTLEFPIVTDTDGKWETPKVEMVALTDAEKAQGATAIKYDVEFVYDGQTYEPTLFLSKLVSDTEYAEGSASEYINSSTSGRDAFANRSMAKDYDRENVNSRIESIYGKTEINGNGSTTGSVNGSEGEKYINYESSINGNNATRVESKLVTTNKNGVALDLFKTKARTSVGGLEYPFDDKIHLESYDPPTLTYAGIKQSYHYSATYNYCLHINLGLVRRQDVDLEVTKDLYSAKVVVDGKALDYRFNKLADIGKEVLNRQIEIDKQNISYELGLYKTDYYYRAEIYRTNSQVYNAVQTFYKKIGRDATDSELEVYLTYKIDLSNYSPTTKYVTKINSIDDYFDSSFGAPIQEKVEKIINGELQEVANSSYIEIDGRKAKVNWTVQDKNINGSNNTTYNKMTADLTNLTQEDGQKLEVKLESGRSAEIYVTFAVQKSDLDGVKDAIELGDKSNIVEISNYSTYYKEDGKIAGKVDRDSAPANVNIRDYNTKPWYEDDTDSAPVLNLNLMDDNRAITGTAWEDRVQDNNETNGLREDDEALIGGLTTELIEKITVDGIDYDFLWPTNTKLDCLGGKTLEYLTNGFASTVETSTTTADIDGLGIGEYKFTNVPTGTYVVRFLYGNDKTKLEDTSKIKALDAASSLKADGTMFNNSQNEDGSRAILTANYDGDQVGKTPAVYNGQDYKATIYQAQVEKATGANDAWHDLSNANLATSKVSDARDSESRRLEIIANSQTITNVVGNILATANDVKANHTELYNNYNMFADTAKIDLNIESKDAEGLAGVNAQTVLGTITSNSVRTNKETTNYTIGNIDIGLAERPETKLILDKEIKEIKLTTNDDKVIFDAIYDINYEVQNLSDAQRRERVVISDLGSNNYLVANVVLNTDKSVGIDALQAINKSEIKTESLSNDGLQNFRYINIDEELLQGINLELNYLITALNLSEADYTSKALYEATIQSTDRLVVKDAILDLANKAKEAESKSTGHTVGEFLGTHYYTGNIGNDVIVKTKVRQIVDYVDNDAMFSATDNVESNHMWRNTTITELIGNGHEANRLIDRNVIPEYSVLDENGVSYISNQKNNLIVSVDNQEEGIASNKEFEKELVPYSQDAENYNSQIALTVSKTVSAQTEANNMTYDNIAEIIKFENTVGRRDVTSTVGNANPKLGEFTTAITERDESATELITFTPPTGIESESIITTQILIVTIVALGIVAVGIVVIKKKVLKK